MKLTHLLFLGLSAIIIASCNSAKEPSIPLQIESKATAPQVRAAGSAFVVGSKAYVLFGRSKKYGGYLKQFVSYDSATDIWTELDTIPMKARTHGVAQVVDNIAYVGLGFNGKIYDEPSYLRDFWAYNPATSTWKRCADYPIPNTNGITTLVWGKYIYACFGYYRRAENFVYRYDTEADVWEKCADTPYNAGFGGSGQSVNDRCFAGLGFRARMMNEWYEYLPHEDKWKKRNSVPLRGCVFASSLVLNNDIYLMGGRFFGGTDGREEFYDEIMRYDIEVNKWELKGYIPEGGRENMITFSIGNKGYIGFGETGEGEIMGDLYTIEE